MPLPGNVNTITVTATYAPNGLPFAGDVTFRPNVPTLVDATAPAFVLGPVTAKLDPNGAISQALALNDNTTLSPSGWLWEVTENILGLPVRPPYLIRLTADMGPTVDLADPRLTPVNPAPPYSTVYGILANPNVWTALNNFANGLAIGGTLIVVPPGGTSRFLAADGTWQLPPSGAVVSVNTKTGAVVLNSTDVGAVPESLVTAKGDLLVASGNGTVARLAAGTNGQLLEANSAAANGVDWVTPATGGSTLKVTRTYITSGAVTFNADAAFAAYPAVGGSIAAAVGDDVELEVGGMWQKVGGDFIDWAVLVGGSPVRYSSSGNGTPCIEGDPGWYPDSGFPRGPGTFGFKATSGDIDVDGKVHFSLMHKGSAGGAWYSNANYPTRIKVSNNGPQ